MSKRLAEFRLKEIIESRKVDDPATLPTVEERLCLDNLKLYHQIEVLENRIKEMGGNHG